MAASIGPVWYCSKVLQGNEEERQKEEEVQRLKRHAGKFQSLKSASALETLHDMNQSIGISVNVQLHLRKDICSGKRENIIL